jgi:hypothetical protein
MTSATTRTSNAIDARQRPEPRPAPPGRPRHTRTRPRRARRWPDHFRDQRLDAFGKTGEIVQPSFHRVDKSAMHERGHVMWIELERPDECGSRIRG